MFGDGDMSFSMAKSAKANKLVEFDCVRCGKHAEIQEGEKLSVVTPKDSKPCILCPYCGERNEIENDENVSDVFSLI